MAECLEQVSKWHEMYCHDLEVMSSNRGWAGWTWDTGSSSVQVVLKAKIHVLSLLQVILELNI